MRIGQRWSVGAELGADTTGWGWTLTYLEGSPVVECDDGTRIRVEGDGVLVERD